MYRRRYTRKPGIPAEIRGASPELHSGHPDEGLREERESPYMTVRELQEHLHICRRTAYTIIHRDGFPAYKVGHSIRIDRKGLDEWLHAHSADEAA